MLKKQQKIWVTFLTFTMLFLQVMDVKASLMPLQMLSQMEEHVTMAAPVDALANSPEDHCLSMMKNESHHASSTEPVHSEHQCQQCFYSCPINHVALLPMMSFALQPVAFTYPQKEPADYVNSVVGLLLRPPIS